MSNMLEHVKARLCDYSVVTFLERFSSKLTDFHHHRCIHWPLNQWGVVLLYHLVRGGSSRDLHEATGFSNTHIFEMLGIAIEQVMISNLSS